jgi:hypothetical protein
MNDQKSNLSYKFFFVYLKFHHNSCLKRFII